MQKLLLPMNQAEWIKAISHIRCRDRRFSSLTAWRQISESNHGPKFWEHRSVRHSGTASRYTVVFRLHMPFSWNWSFLPCSWENIILKVLPCLYKSRRKRNPNEITDYFVCAANAHAWMSCILYQYAPARTIWKNTSLLTALNQKKECLYESACTIVEYASRKTHLNVPHGGNN